MSRKKKENWNADKHGCLACKYSEYISYRGGSTDAKNEIFCDYIGHTGHMRSAICTADNCTVFERGERKGKGNGKKRSRNYWYF